MIPSRQISSMPVVSLSDVQPHPPRRVHHLPRLDRPRLHWRLRPRQRGPLYRFRGNLLPIFHVVFFEVRPASSPSYTSFRSADLTLYHLLCLLSSFHHAVTSPTLERWSRTLWARSSPELNCRDQNSELAAPPPPSSILPSVVPFRFLTEFARCASVPDQISIPLFFLLPFVSFDRRSKGMDHTSKLSWSSRSWEGEEGCLSSRTWGRGDRPCRTRYPWS